MTTHTSEGTTRSVSVRGGSIGDALQRGLAEVAGCAPGDVDVRIDAPGLDADTQVVELRIEVDGAPGPAAEASAIAASDDPAEAAATEAAASAEPAEPAAAEAAADEVPAVAAAEVATTAEVADGSVDDDDVEDGVGVAGVAGPADGPSDAAESGDGIDADHGDGPGDEDDDADLDAEADAAADFIEGLLDILGLPGDLQIRTFPDHAEVEVVDVGSGALIGRRGQTLEAIQELLRCSLQREFQRRARVRVDVEGYRTRRLEKLQEKAIEAIEDVQRSGGAERLEPMDVFERKIIHQLVADHEGVTSRSQGREPGRRVIIEAED